MDTEQINRIEIALAHQSKQIEDLSDMVYAQGKEIQRLKVLLESTRQQIKTFESGIKDEKSEVGLSGIEIAALNKPPHY